MYQYCASNGLCVNNGTDEGLTPYSLKGCSVQDWTRGVLIPALMSALLAAESASQLAALENSAAMALADVTAITAHKYFLSVP
ncbi:hypothetical protein BDV11DRAFT_189315 [Aspergillus similis]